MVGAAQHLSTPQLYGPHFIDDEGRIVTLRGWSVTGSCKLPATPDLPTHSTDLEGFFDHRNVSFVGRPFPLVEADEHLERLARWGTTFLRLLVPWEALEHAGPGLYDDAYIDYLRQLIEKMPRHGIKCIIDSHQDVWSRLCGGSGAPGWTLELAGFDIDKLHDCLASIVHARSLNDPYAAWPTGYQKLAAATMFTLFWTGDAHAPLLRIPTSSHAHGDTLFPSTSTVGIGTFLRRSHSGAYAYLARAIRHCEAVVGFEPMNEPHRGYINLFSFDTWDPYVDLLFGHVPSPLQSMALGDGRSMKVPFYDRSFPEPTSLKRYDLIRPPASGCWRDGCIWRRHGVWEWDEVKKRAIVMRRGYFERLPGRGETRIDYFRDCWWPFLREFGEAIQEVRKDWWLVAGAIPNENSPMWPKALQPKNLVFAPHFYDLHLLFSKYAGNISINVQGLSRGMFILNALHLGRQGIKNNYTIQLGNIVENAREATGTPTLVGETGILYNFNSSRHHKTRDFRWHERGLDAILTALERVAPQAGVCLWCYSPNNTAAHGDGWMEEDFSCVSKDDGELSAEGGARCLDAHQRPYASRTAGVPIRADYDMHSLAVDYRFRNARPSDGLAGVLKSRETLIYLPRRRYGGRQLYLEVSDGTTEYNEETLSWRHEDTTPGFEHTLQLRVVGALSRVAPPDIDLDRQTKAVFATALVVVLAVLMWEVT